MHHKGVLNRHFPCIFWHFMSLTLPVEGCQCCKNVYLNVYLTYTFRFLQSPESVYLNVYLSVYPKPRSITMFASLIRAQKHPLKGNQISIESQLPHKPSARLNSSLNLPIFGHTSASCGIVVLPATN